jgi:hypothetical protein
MMFRSKIRSFAQCAGSKPSQGRSSLSLAQRQSANIHASPLPARRGARIWVALGLMATTIIFSGPAAAGSGAAPERLIAQPIDERNLVTLAGRAIPAQKPPRSTTVEL